MTKIRLENEQAIEELGKVIYDNYYDEVADEEYDDDWEVCKGVSVKYLKELNSLGEGCLMIDNDITSQDFIDEIFIDLNRVDCSKLSKSVFIWGDEISFEPDGTLRIWWD